MPCLPSGCRCEERLLAPFLRRYNKRKGTAYEFSHRLDVGSHTPQPEAFYIDRISGAELVIERKNLVWPSDFAKVHDSLHMVAAIAGAEATPHLDPTKPYELKLPARISGPLHELREHGKTIGRTIIQKLDAIHAGETVGSSVRGRKWRFRMEAAHERDWDEQPAGIRYLFSGGGSPLDWGEIPDGLPDEFQRLLDSANAKFATYLNAGRVLVFDFIGDVQHPSSYIERLFETVSMPVTVGEIWMSTYGLVTELHYGWIHQQLWPQLGEISSELSGETIVPLSDDAN